MRKAIPSLILSSFLLCACASTDPIVSALSNHKEQTKFYYARPSQDSVKQLDPAISSASALPALLDLEETLINHNGSLTVSPASYLLAVYGLAATSSNFDNAAFGLSNNALEHAKALLKAWNFEYYYGNEYMGEDYCAFLSALAFQSVGNTYPFDEEKQKEFVSSYISTMQSSLSSYHKDAEYLFHDLLDFQIPVPDPKLDLDGVLAYSGLRIKDYVAGGLFTAKKAYLEENVDSYVFGNIYEPYIIPYYEGEDFEVFRLKINYTDLTIILPKISANLEDISISDAYDAFLNHHKNAYTMGYVPYFKITSNEINLTDALTSKCNGNELFFDKLLQDDVVNDLGITSVLQNNEFEFNQYGVSGESITVIATEGKCAPEEHEVKVLNVDRPFFAISEKDGFPLFVSKVIDLH